jgi:hypothetical protein
MPVAQQIEISDVVLVAGCNFRQSDRSGKQRGNRRLQREALSPVATSARDQPYATSSHRSHEAKSIMLDLVQLAIINRQFLRRRWKAWLNV